MDDLSRRVAEHPGWYHTIDLAPGVSTPGFCDLRPFAPAGAARVAERQALPGRRHVRRLLGLPAREQRGADVVYALDLPDGTQADWPPNTREANLAESRGDRSGVGLGLQARPRGARARRCGASRATSTTSNVEWLDGEPVDAVLCGTILQHLRDPVRALENMRDVLRAGRRAADDRGLLGAADAPAPEAARSPSSGRRCPARSSPGGCRTSRRCAAWPQTAGFRPIEGAPVARHRPLRGAGKGDHVISMRYTR